MECSSLGIVMAWILCSEMVLETEAVRDVKHSKNSTHSVFFIGMVLGSVVFVLALLGFILLTYRARPVLETLDEDVSQLNSRSGSKVKKTMSVVAPSASSVTIGTQSLVETRGNYLSETPIISHSAIGFVNPVYQTNHTPPQSPVIRRRQQSIEESSMLQEGGSLVVDLDKTSSIVPRTDSNSSVNSVVELFQRSLSCINTAVRSPFSNPLFTSDSKELSPSSSNRSKKKPRSKKRVSFKFEAQPSV